jgi:hypothetical protein
MALTQEEIYRLGMEVGRFIFQTVRIIRDGHDLTIRETVELSNQYLRNFNVQFNYENLDLCAVYQQGVGYGYCQAQNE